MQNYNCKIAYNNYNLIKYSCYSLNNKCNSSNNNDYLLNYTIYVP